MIKIKNKEIPNLWECPELKGNVPGWTVCCAFDDRLSQLDGLVVEKDFEPIKWTRSDVGEPMFLVAVRTN